MSTLEGSSDSLIAALAKANITSANHGFIREFTTAIGIISYRVVELSDRSYVVATRRDGLPDLYIYWGYTTGFTTAEEALHIAGSSSGCGPSSSRKGTWYVAHPVNKVRPDGDSTRNKRREAGICAGCGEQLPLTGVCDNCD